MDCKKCGNCCRHKLIAITEDEYKFLLERFPIIEKHIKDFQIEKVIIDCPFLNKDNCCSIYDYRPLMCKFFPFTTLKNRKTDLDYLKLRNDRHNEGIYEPIFDSLEGLGVWTDCEVYKSITLKDIENAVEMYDEIKFNAQIEIEIFGISKCIQTEEDIGNFINEYNKKKFGGPKVMSVHSYHFYLLSFASEQEKKRI